MTLTIGSLHSGLGGFELGLQWAGLGDVKWQVEKNGFYHDVLAKHWPESVQTRDLTGLAPVDLVCASIPARSPYQSVRASNSNADPWHEFYEVIRETNPKYVAIVQRTAFLRRGLSDVLGQMADLGFDAWWDRVSDQSVGAPYRSEILTAVFWHPVDRARRRRSQPCVVGTGSRVPARLDGPWPTGQNRAVEPWEPKMHRGETPKRSFSKQIVIPQMSYLIGRLIREIENEQRTR